MKLFEPVSKMKELGWDYERWTDVVVVWRVDPYSRQFPFTINDFPFWDALAAEDRRVLLFNTWSYFTASELEAFSKYVETAFRMPLEMREVESSTKVFVTVAESMSFIDPSEYEDYPLPYKIVGGVCPATKCDGNMPGYKIVDLELARPSFSVPPETKQTTNKVAQFARREFSECNLHLEILGELIDTFGISTPFVSEQLKKTFADLEKHKDALAL